MMPPTLTNAPSAITALHARSCTSTTPAADNMISTAAFGWIETSS
jgi:hypothetical protein